MSSFRAESQRTKGKLQIGHHIFSFFFLTLDPNGRHTLGALLLT
jgi:hypothetical protein